MRLHSEQNIIFVCRRARKMDGAAQKQEINVLMLCARARLLLSFFSGTVVLCIDVFSARASGRFSDARRTSHHDASFRDVDDKDSLRACCIFNACKYTFRQSINSLLFRAYTCVLSADSSSSSALTAHVWGPWRW